METVRAERDGVVIVIRLIRDTEALRRSVDREGTPGSIAYQGKKSTKMPDPPIFSNSKLVKFDD